jgi:hypothetical protein
MAEAESVKRAVFELFVDGEWCPITAAGTNDSDGVEDPVPEDWDPVDITVCVAYSAKQEKPWGVFNVIDTPRVMRTIRHRRKGMQ